MNSLIGQLPEWMRSPAALIAGGLLLLFLLVLVIRRRADAATHGLPSGRGWRGKVPLPNQASPLDAMRAALESSPRIQSLRQAAPVPSAVEDVPGGGATEAEGRPALEAGTSTGPQEDQSAAGSDVSDPARTDPAGAVDNHGDDAANVVPLRAGSASTKHPAEDADGEDEGAVPAVPEQVREQKKG
ncbi:MAG TPA: hypothetical protein VK013_11140 [Myxococcaceae bacterium]|nr:hypothetical protein [Myxococcaceae bacterium]